MGTDRAIIYGEVIKSLRIQVVSEEVSQVWTANFSNLTHYYNFRLSSGSSESLTFKKGVSHGNSHPDTC